VLLGPQLEAFRDAGFEIHTASAPGPFVERLEAAGIVHHPLGHATRAMSVVDDGRAALELYRILRQVRPAIIHTHTPKAGIYGRVMAKAARVPVVVNTVHGLYALPEDPALRRTVVYGLERLAASCSDGELFQNAEDLDTMARVGVSRSKLHLLGNGVDLQRFSPERADRERVAKIRAGLDAGPDDVVVGVVARMVWSKGFHEVFAAAAALRDRLPNVRFVVVGPKEPDKAEGVDEQSIARAEADGVRFLGMRADMVDLHAAFDIYLLPSYYREGVVRSGMEAAAMATPVITANSRGCRQVVDDGITGILVPPRDADAVTEAVAALATDPARRQAMGKAGRAKAEAEFDDRRCVQITLDLYKQLLGRAC
jgi:glycosyltransferase involved in cell wall biosynthesis